MSNELRPQELVNAPLGQTSAYPERYDASLLFPIPRAQGRQHLSLQPQPEWFGEDVWRAFEVSWLNLKVSPRSPFCVSPFPPHHRTSLNPNPLSFT